ncbi:MAG TPA: NUDIX hydrolase [Spongiibacteraceae bacterium]|nr:NUDIX hydrolase [Spongiibacteraceae bacterium]
MSAIRSAATVVLLRECGGRMEVLLLRRNDAVQFAGGLWVFPGGAIDPDDFAGDADDIMSAARRAAIREAHEETGLDISECALQFFAHWTTPEGSIKRYATWFFVAALANGEADVVIDGSEIVAHRWIDPHEAIALHRASGLHMMPPTFITLTELADCHSVIDVEAMYRDRPVIEILPRFVAHESSRVALYPHDSGYESGDAKVQGRKHRCYRGEDGWHYECDLFDKK